MTRVYRWSYEPKLNKGTPKFPYSQLVNSNGLDVLRTPLLVISGVELASKSYKSGKRQIH